MTKVYILFEIHTKHVCEVYAERSMAEQWGEYYTSKSPRDGPHVRDYMVIEKEVLHIA